MRWCMGFWLDFGGDREWWADWSKQVVIVHTCVGRRNRFAGSVHGDDLVVSFQNTEAAGFGRLLTNGGGGRIGGYVLSNKVLARNRNINDSVAPLTKLASPGEHCKLIRRVLGTVRGRRMV